MTNESIKIDRTTSPEITMTGKKIREIMEEAMNNSFDFVQIHFINGDYVYISIRDLLEVWYEKEKITFLHRTNLAMSQISYKNINSMSLVRNNKPSQTRSYRIQWY